MPLATRQQLTDVSTSSSQYNQIIQVLMLVFSVALQMQNRPNITDSNCEVVIHANRLKVWPTIIFREVRYFPIACSDERNNLIHKIIHKTKWMKDNSIWLTHSWKIMVVHSDGICCSFRPSSSSSVSIRCERQNVASNTRILLSPASGKDKDFCLLMNLADACLCF